MADFKKKIFYYALCMTLTAQTGCSLLPQEEVLPVAPVAESYSIREYVKTQVISGDIIETITIPTVYRASKSEDIKFPQGNVSSGNSYLGGSSLGNKRLEEVFVKVGDKVKAGDLVAVLETGDLSEKITNLVNEIELLTLRLKQSKEMNQLVKDSSTMKIREIEETIYIKSKRLDEWLKEKESCEVRAGIDGTVHYIIDLNTQLKSTKDVTIAKVLDETSCYYEADEMYSSYFTIGESVMITTDRGEIEAEVVPDSHKPMDNTGLNIYFKLPVPDFDIPVGSKGTIKKVTDGRENIRIVSANAIIETEDGYYVYMEDEEGLKSLKKIEVGLIADGKAEIVSGLEEGDSIIIE